MHDFWMDFVELVIARLGKGTSEACSRRAGVIFGNGGGVSLPEQEETAEARLGCRMTWNGWERVF